MATIHVKRSNDGDSVDIFDDGEKVYADYSAEDLASTLAAYTRLGDTVLVDVVGTDRVVELEVVVSWS